VAGAFENRSPQACASSADPTVIYGMERLENTTGRLQGRFELRSLYNTYEHGGLPPGRSEILAKRRYAPHWRPAETNYLYFVANTQGGHFFGATLVETQQKCGEVPSVTGGLPADPPPPPPSPRKNTSSNTEAQPDDRRFENEKGAILETAREIKVQQWTPAEIDQLRRRLLRAWRGWQGWIRLHLQTCCKTRTKGNHQSTGEAEEQYEENSRI